MARVVLAMSGGVDSSVAAYLLQQQGHEVIGVFMRHGEETTAACDERPQSSGLLPIVDPQRAARQGCCTASDALDARRVADRLRIPFYALNLEADFRRIIDYFVASYQAGETPNPCVQCNNWVKFGRLFEYAASVDAEYVATGHYARLVDESHPLGVRLLRGVDAGKDQSYVLFGISREFLPRMMLPVGAYQKSEIRELAAQVGLRVAQKKDSQEICFVEAGRHAEFVRQRGQADSTAGQIVTTQGETVGEHEGIEGFTIGQRKGLGVAMGEPYYVVRIDRHTNQVVIGSREALACERLWARDLNWLVDPPGPNFPCLVQIRYNSRAVAAQVTLGASGELEVAFREPCYGVAPGQAVVCYDDDQVLGGGWITRTTARHSGSVE